MTEHPTYHTDVLTVRMLARMPGRIDDICAALGDDTGFQTTVGAGPVPGDRAIRTATFIAWARKRLICDIRFMNGTRFADGALCVAGALPQTLRIAASGRPCTDVLPHDAFEGIAWMEEQPDDTSYLHADLESDIDLGIEPGRRLRELALAELAKDTRQAPFEMGR